MRTMQQTLLLSGSFMYDCYMATRTGVAILDEIIEQWLASDPLLFGSLHHLSDMALQDGVPAKDQASVGMCFDVADAFVGFVNKELRARHLTQPNRDTPERFAWTDRELFDIRFFGYDDHPEENGLPDNLHTGAFLVWGRELFFVDWTAGQFGYQEFPMVLRYNAPPELIANDLILNQEPEWLREWPSTEVSDLELAQVA